MQKLDRFKTSHRKIIFSSVALIALSACTASVDPLTSSDIRGAAADRTARYIASDQEPLNGAVGLHEAMARALKYNLDRKIELARLSLRAGDVDLANMEMLPEFVASSDYSRRSNSPGGYSIDVNSGTQSTSASRSVHQDSRDSSLSLSWNILDFGLSYYRAKQAGNNALIAAEDRRIMTNRLMEDVRTAYWRAVSAQRLEQKIDRLLNKANRALSNSRSLSSQGVTDPLNNLRYQRDLLRIISEVKTLRREMSVAKSQLAALINIAPGTHYSVVVPSQPTMPKVSMNAAKLTEIAMLNRPELRTITYEQRNLEMDRKAQVLQMLPSIGPFITAQATSNNLVLNQDWMNAGVRASWDLMNLFRSGANRAHFAASEALLDARALALTQAVATQVYVARERYAMLKDEVAAARDFRDVSRKISQSMSDETVVGTRGLQEGVFEEMNALLAELRYDTKFAELQNTYANLFSAVGLNVYPITEAETLTLQQLEDQIHSAWTELGEGLH